MISDITLINQIKTKNDSAAVTELVNRHTGMYINVVKKYSCYPDFLARANVDDLKDEKFYNIYQWALKFDPKHEMKFGSYVGQMTKYLCQGFIQRGKASVEFNEYSSPTNDTGVVEASDRHATLEEIDSAVSHSESELFKKIFQARFSGQKPLSWRKIAAIVGLSHEGARKIYEKNIGTVRKTMSE